MRLLSQNIAQRANRDDKETGKFWQARYRAVRLLDETSLLACAAYVDLNPIRAAMAKTLEESQYTSIKHRIEALREKGAACEKRQAGMLVPRDGYLAPLSIDELRDPIGPCGHRHGQRASDKGFLSMPIESYLELLDWTARQIVRGKRGSTPASARPVLERLGISAPTWCALVKDFGRLFYAVAGQPHSIDAHRSRRGCEGHRYKTRRRTRELLSTA